MARGDKIEGTDEGVTGTARPRPGVGVLESIGSPTWGQPDHPAARRLAAAVPGSVVRTKEHRGELTVIVALERLVEAARFMRDEEGYDFCSDAVGADYLGYEGQVAGYWSGGGELAHDMNDSGTRGKGVVPDRPGDKRFAVSYNLLKLRTALPQSAASRRRAGISREGDHRRLRLQVWADDGEPVPSLVPVYPSLDFQEREVYDMFGIVFDGHPNLKRILMPDDWGGHPQRKDYPVGGEPVQFSDTHYEGGHQ